MRLKGKTALISGAGRNNGKAIALAFAREGADLVLVARQLGDELKQVASACEKFGVRTLALLGDVSRHEDVDRLVKQGIDHFSKIDVLVSVAGVRPHKPFLEVGNDEWLNVFALNLHSTFYFAKALAPGMMERRSGSIVALGGGAALTSQPFASSVVSSKHGLYGLIKSLALELGPYNVRANMLALSHIKNERRNPEWYAYAGGEPHAAMSEDSTPLRREGRPEEVANVAVFLASDDSSYITGDRISCSGGRHM